MDPKKPILSNNRLNRETEYFFDVQNIYAWQKLSTKVSLRSPQWQKLSTKVSLRSPRSPRSLRSPQWQKLSTKVSLRGLRRLTWVDSFCNCISSHSSEITANFRGLISNPCIFKYNEPVLTIKTLMI